MAEKGSKAVPVPRTKEGEREERFSFIFVKGGGRKLQFGLTSLFGHQQGKENRPHRRKPQLRKEGEGGGKHFMRGRS